MSTLQTLTEMSRNLGRPEHDYVILGEGNTSARVDDDTFYVKASGFNLASIEAEGFVKVRFDAALAILDEAGLKRRRGQEPAAGRHGGQPGPALAVGGDDVSRESASPWARPPSWATPIPPQSTPSCSQQAEAAVAGRSLPGRDRGLRRGAGLAPGVDPGTPWH
ncbi:MAG: class II aldolase/adducin family protein [Caldilineaceae bacterium]